MVGLGKTICLHQSYRNSAKCSILLNSSSLKSIVNRKREKVKKLNLLTITFTYQEYPQHWTAISEQILFESDLWSELYCPLFAQRTKELLTNHWEDVFPVIISDIDSALIQ